MLDDEDNKKENWVVYSDCESVWMKSPKFEGNFVVIIGDISYRGEDEINTILPTNFTVAFLSWGRASDRSFVLHWSCTEFGEWTPAIDGTCRHVQKPLHQGTSANEFWKYKLFETCGK